jgi:hypothetical protein
MQKLTRCVDTISDWVGLDAERREKHLSELQQKERGKETEREVIEKE